MKNLIHKNHLRHQNLIYPLFIIPNNNIHNPITSLKNQYQLNINKTIKKTQKTFDNNVPTIILFKIPKHKNALNTKS